MSSTIKGVRPKRTRVEVAALDGFVHPIMSNFECNLLGETVSIEYAGNLYAWHLAIGDDFKPEEIKIKPVSNAILIEARAEREDEIFEFDQEVAIPKEVKSSDFNYSLNSNGILRIQVWLDESQQNLTTTTESTQMRMTANAKTTTTTSVVDSRSDKKALINNTIQLQQPVKMETTKMVAAGKAEEQTSVTETEIKSPAAAPTKLVTKTKPAQSGTPFRTPKGLGLKTDLALTPVLATSQVEDRVDTNDITKMMTYEGDRNKFEVALDFASFAPEEVQVKILKNMIIISAEQKNFAGVVINSYYKKFTYPPCVKDAENIRATFTTNGMLKLYSVEGGGPAGGGGGGIINSGNKKMYVKHNLIRGKASVI